MSKARAKGTFAETAVAEYMNVWFKAVSVDHTAVIVETTGYELRYPDAASDRYPQVLTPDQYDHHPDWDVVDEVEDAVLPFLYRENTVRIDPNSGRNDWDIQGLPFARQPSKGANDEGDVHGPFTAIEVKNYANPPVSELLTNAEWKAANAGKPYWLLCYKADGKGWSSIGQWHGLVTAEHLIEAYGAAFTLADVPSLCHAETVMDFTPALIAPGMKRPRINWTVRLIFTNSVGRIKAFRERAWLEHYSFEDRVIPIVISPRREVNNPDGSGWADPGRWYAYSKLAGFARILETLGVLPQDADEYAEKVS